jgi:hypothetical protein
MKKVCPIQCAAQEFAGADDVFLADELIQGARAHAGGQRGLGIHAFLQGVFEQVRHGAIIMLVLVLNREARKSAKILFAREESRRAPINPSRSLRSSR